MLLLQTELCNMENDKRRAGWIIPEDITVMSHTTEVKQHRITVDYIQQLCVCVLPDSLVQL